MAKKKDKLTPVISFPTIKHIRPKTIHQNEVFKSFHQGSHLCLHGLAGTGKSFISLFLGLSAVLSYDSKFEKMIIIRSVVPTREIGFLPGSIKEKIEIYEQPYRDMSLQLFDNKADYDYLKACKKLEFQTTSHLRGLTFNNAIILVDEMQNMNFMELSTTITRVGDNCRIIYSGDTSQSDLRDYEKNDIQHFLSILKNMPSFHSITFTSDDILRSALVKEFIIEKEAYFGRYVQ